MATVAFHESAHAEVLKPISGKTGSDWDIVFLRKGWSKNDRYYAADVLKASIPFFENYKVCTYHLGDKFEHIPQEVIERFDRSKLSMNVVGWFENVRYGAYTNRKGQKGEGLLAKFHIMEGHKWLRDNLRDAWQHKREDILGFSIDARGDSRPGFTEGRHGEIVYKITKADETTVVTDPAAGGEILRLVASVQGGKPMKALYELLLESCPHWFELHDKAEPDEDLNSYLQRMLETVIIHARGEQMDIPADEGDLLQEVARGVNMLNELKQFVDADKADEAVALVRKWTAGRTEESVGSNVRARRFMSIPYGIPQIEESRKETVVEDKKIDEAGHLDKKKKKEEEMARLAALRKREGMVRVKEKVVESGLRKEVQDRIVAAFDAFNFADVTDEDLDTKIDGDINSMREFVSSITESGKVKGLGDVEEKEVEVEVTSSQNEKWASALEGFWDGRGNKVNGVTPFTSIKEAWIVINQPRRHLKNRYLSNQVFQAMKCAFPTDEFTDMEDHLVSIRESWSRVAQAYRLTEATTSSTFSVLFGDSVNIFLQKLATSDPRSDYTKIVSSNLNANDFSNVLRLVRTGGFNDIAIVAEGAPYQEITPTRTENEEQISPNKRGGLEKLTMEAILADRMDEVRRIPKALQRAANRTISKDVWNQIESNPNVTDGNPLIGGTTTLHLNEVSTSPVLSATAVADAIQLLVEQTEQDSGEKIGLEPKFLLVSKKLADEAFEIVSSTVKATSNEDATVANFVKSKGIEVISTLGLGRTTTTDDRWYIMADPADSDTIGAGWLDGKRDNEIFVQSPMDTPTAGDAFNSDTMTFKIRLNYVGSANFDHRYITGSLQ